RKVIGEDQDPDLLDSPKTFVIGNEAIAPMNHSRGNVNRVEHLHTVFGAKRRSGFDDIAAHFPDGQVWARSDDLTVPVCEISPALDKRLHEQLSQDEEAASRSERSGTESITEKDVRDLTEDGVRLELVNPDD